MSQERSLSKANAEHLREPNPLPQAKQVIASAPTSNHYWRMLTNPRFSPPVVNLGPPVVTTEAFLEGPQRPTAEVRLDSPTTIPVRSWCRSQDSAQASPDLDTLSSDFTDSLRKQVRQVHQRLDEVQKEFFKSKEEFGESPKGGSPFTPEIQDSSYRLTSVHRRFCLPFRSNYTSCHIWRGAEVQNIDGVVYGGATPVSIQRIGRPTLNRLKAAVSTYHKIMKFLTGAGVGEARSDPGESRQCYLTTMTLPKRLKVPTTTTGPQSPDRDT
ncbi:hypothetical protein GW17_00012951 [Ensete ventricosum]|nr:hypothetical protein GW17_00012951 [Ensete ventricosum]